MVFLSIKDSRSKAVAEQLVVLKLSRKRVLDLTKRLTKAIAHEDEMTSSFTRIHIVVTNWQPLARLQKSHMA